MKSKAWWFVIALTVVFAAAAEGGTFGKVVQIGGQASDLALDEARGVLYIANFPANRIEVMSLADHAIRASLNVAPRPGSLSLSLDGRYLVVAHFGNFEAPNTPYNALTIIDRALEDQRRTIPLASPPLGVAFGKDNRALVVTGQEFLLLDPGTGTLERLDTVAGAAARALPAPPASFPAQIVAASLAASGDGRRIYGLTDTMWFRYDVDGRLLSVQGYTAEPPMGPRVVSVNRDGTSYTAGWGLFDERGTLLAQFPNAAGLLQVGGHALDSSRGLVYAQIPEAGSGLPNPLLQPPVLQIADAGNLAVRERLRLPENMAGKSLLSSDSSTLYAISDSGVMVLPVGSIEAARRLYASEQDVVFQTDLCRRETMTREFALIDQSGAATDFSLVSTLEGVKVTPSAGTTPAWIQVTVDPAVFLGRQGTQTGYIQVRSNQAVNLPKALRVLINVREPDQRGEIHNVPGKLVDILSDPERDRFYILRQDTNEVLVFDAATHRAWTSLHTGNTPTQMALTPDRRYLLVANENSQIANIYDLQTLAARSPIRFPPGHYPHSIAVSGRTALAASRVAGPKHTLDRFDPMIPLAAELPHLGALENKIHRNTVLAASPNGGYILGVQADGGAFLYDSGTDAFVTWRRDFTELAGAYAASNNGMYAAGGFLFNSSLVPVAQMAGAGTPSGFQFSGQTAFRTLASPGGPGAISRVDLASGAQIAPTRMVESPLSPDPASVFTRTLAVLERRNELISLTESGFVVLPAGYDAPQSPPRLDAIRNAADFSEQVASGGLVSLFGQNLATGVAAAGRVPLPASLAESCLTVNGMPVPLLYVSPGQINAQMPFEVDGRATVQLRTPAGVSNNLNLTVAPAAPSVFRSGAAGPERGLATIFRALNYEPVTPANPVHPGDTLVIYLTGLGRTSPPLATGSPGPVEPLARAALTPTVQLGGVPLPLDYAGMAPGLVGVYQINARVPDWVQPGMSVGLSIIQGAESTTVNVRVVR